VDAQDRFGKVHDQHARIPNDEITDLQLADIDHARSLAGRRRLPIDTQLHALHLQPEPIRIDTRQYRDLCAGIEAHVHRLAIDLRGHEKIIAFPGTRLRRRKKIQPIHLPIHREARLLLADAPNHVIGGKNRRSRQSILFHRLLQRRLELRPIRMRRASPAPQVATHEKIRRRDHRAHHTDLRRVGAAHRFVDASPGDLCGAIEIAIEPRKKTLVHRVHARQRNLGQLDKSGAISSLRGLLRRRRSVADLVQMRGCFLGGGVRGEGEQ
ncbi:hypothetical protein KCV01_g26426, partial [Aureobasidium melanogenum]